MRLLQSVHRKRLTLEFSTLTGGQSSAYTEAPPRAGPCSRHEQRSRGLVRSHKRSVEHTHGGPAPEGTRIAGIRCACCGRTHPLLQTYTCRAGTRPLSGNEISVSPTAERSVAQISQPPALSCETHSVVDPNSCTSCAVPKVEQDGEAKVEQDDRAKVEQDDQAKVEQDDQAKVEQYDEAGQGDGLGQGSGLGQRQWPGTGQGDGLGQGSGLGQRPWPA
eukprot:356415-Chlamydomonas_euryale.AAC.1